MTTRVFSGSPSFFDHLLNQLTLYSFFLKLTDDETYAHFLAFVCAITVTMIMIPLNS